MWSPWSSFRGVGGRRGPLSLREAPGGWREPGKWLTVTLAAQVVLGLFTEPAPGSTATDVAVSGACGVLYGVASSGGPALEGMGRLLGRAVEVAVGVLAIVPITTAFFSRGSGRSPAGQPIWVSVAIFAGVVLALAASVLLSLLRTATGELLAASSWTGSPQSKNSSGSNSARGMTRMRGRRWLKAFASYSRS